jgi:ATP-dependent Clp protease ATP-binding subunit ClpC
MFERFTDRARSVLVLAQEEARLLNHSFIGTEHILLGLVRQEDAISGKVLASFGLTLDSVRHQVDETVGTADALEPQPPSGSPPFTARAKKVLELSLREALQLGHSYIGTEHIFLGMVREGEGVGARVLVSLGVDLAAARQRVMQFMSGYVTAEGEEGAEGERARMSHSTRTPLTPTSEPRCPQCRADLAEGTRFRTIEVMPDAHDEGKDPLVTVVVYCAHCGISLHTFTAEP